MLFLWYPKCSTCINAKKHLDNLGYEYKARDIKLDNPSFDELSEWHLKSGLDIKIFFNISGLVYRELGLKDKLSTMTLGEKIQLLSSDGMLIKRPLLITKDKIIIGNKLNEYDNL